MGKKLADRLAGTTWTAQQLPLDDALGVIREAGLTKVEIWAEGVHLDPLAGGYRPTAVRTALANDLTVVSVHLPFHPIPASASAEERTRDWVQRCQETLRCAAELGARFAVAHPMIHLDPGEPEQPGARRLTGALRSIATTAATVGMRVAVENMSQLPGPTLRSVDDILTVLPAVSPPLGLCLDVGHAIFNGFNGVRLGEQVHAASGRLLTTHVHDSKAVGTDPHLAPGEGIADWPKFISALWGYSVDRTTLRSHERVAASRRRALPALRG